MKYFAAIFLFVLLCAFGESDTHKRGISGCFVRAQTPTKGVSKKMTRLDITFRTTTGEVITDSIRYSHNGVNGVLHPNDNGFAQVTIPSGTTRFQFLYTTEYYEVYSDTILLKGGHAAAMDVSFDNASGEIIADKPVIYVYPDVTTQVNIHLDVHGTLGFTYPAYYTVTNADSARSGWSFTADPDGTIHMNGKEYDYLFWDARIPFTASKAKSKEGFIVERDSLVPFFEKNLTAMGLNAREQQDFITYWCPLMQKNKKSFVHFLFNEDYNSIANIHITPKPDQLFRVFMTWEDGTAMKQVDVVPQKIQSVTREGFTVIEWGGAEVTKPSAQEVN